MGNGKCLISVLSGRTTKFERLNKASNKKSVFVTIFGVEGRKIDNFMLRLKTNSGRIFHAVPAANQQILNQRLMRGKFFEILTERKSWARLLINHRQSISTNLWIFQAGAAEILQSRMIISINIIDTLLKIRINNSSNVSNFSYHSRNFYHSPLNKSAQEFFINFRFHGILTSKTFQTIITAKPRTVFVSCKIPFPNQTTINQCDGVSAMQ